MPCPERRERRRPGHRSRTPRCGRWRGRRSVRTASTWMPVTPPLGPSLRRPPAGGEQPRRHQGIPPVDLDHGEGRQEDGGGAHGAQHSASVQPDSRAVARHPTRHVGARVTVLVPVRSNRRTVRPAARPAPRPAPGGTAADTEARTSTDPRATEWKIQGHPHVWGEGPSQQDAARSAGPGDRTPYTQRLAAPGFGGEPGQGRGERGPGRAPMRRVPGRHARRSARPAGDSLRLPNPSACVRRSWHTDSARPLSTCQAGSGRALSITVHPSSLVPRAIRPAPGSSRSPGPVQLLLPQRLAEQVQTLAQVAPVGAVRQAQAAGGRLLGGRTGEIAGRQSLAGTHPARVVARGRPRPGGAGCAVPRRVRRDRPPDGRASGRRRRRRPGRASARGPRVRLGRTRRARRRTARPGWGWRCPR